MKLKIIILLLMGVLFIPIGAGIAREAATDYQIPWDAYASGGEQMTSGNYALTGMAGQSIVGGTSGDGEEIGAGFWAVMAEKIYEVFLPLILR